MAPDHHAVVVWQWIQQMFPNHVVVLDQAVEWPERYPDLMLLDFYLCGYLIEQVFKTVLHSIAWFPQRIMGEVQNLK